MSDNNGASINALANLSNLKRSPRVLQSLIFPNDEPCIAAQANHLYFRGDFLIAEAGLALSAGRRVTSETLFNCFSAGKWANHTKVVNLTFAMQIAAGQGRLHLWKTVDWKTSQVCDPIEFCGPSELVVDLCLNGLENGIVFWEIVADTDVICSSARYLTDSEGQDIRLAFIVTAFQRNDCISATTDRFRSSGLADDGHRLLIVDNGQTLHAGAYDWGAIYQNPNLGGAGGFTRGLLEARDEGSFTHALFMDDDASSHVETINRTIAFLRFAKTERLALAGSMLISDYPWMQHEAGAQFRQGFGVQARYGFRDMRDPNNVHANEGSDPIDFGGWWFFAFPIAAVTHLAFPFFVRGDDQLFSMQNHFELATLNGIACWQSDFADKINPSSEYLATRSEFLIALMRSDNSTGSRFRIMLGYAAQVLRESYGYRYGIAGARCDAFDDVCDGPKFWEHPTGQSKVLARIRQRYASHYARSLSLDEATKARLNHPKRYRFLTNRLKHLLLGGHLVPQAVFGHAITMLPSLNAPSGMFLESAAYYYSSTLDRGFIAHRSIFAFTRIAGRLLAQAFHFFRYGSRLKLEYERRLPQLQSEEFWRTQFQK